MKLVLLTLTLSLLTALSVFAIQGKPVTSNYGPTAKSLAVLVDDEFEDQVDDVVHMVQDNAFRLTLKGCEKLTIKDSNLLCLRNNSNVLVGTVGKPISAVGDMAYRVLVREIKLDKNLKYQLLDVGTNRTDYVLVIE